VEYKDYFTVIMDQASNLPASMKPLVPFLKHSQQLEKADPIMSYYCKCYAAQLGIRIRSSNPDDSSKKFLLSLMDQLEQQKSNIGSRLDEPGFGKTHVEKFALKVFHLADEEDLSGKANKLTAMNFLAASQFLEVLLQFGDLTEELKEKQKYAKWKAADISSALKKGIKPNPGPPGEVVEGMKEQPNPTESDNPIPSNPNLSFPSNFPGMRMNSTSDVVPSDFPDFPTFPSNTHGTPSGKNLAGAKPTPLANLSSTNAFPSTVSSSTPVISNLSSINSFPSTVSSSMLPVSDSKNTVTPVSSSVATYTPSFDDCENAAKYAKFAVSSLQFDDVPSAVKNLKLALKSLTNKDY